ncbi:serine protease [uncultured Roseibium sp.]|uniref:serine protease n=1 Tax=uncultured Roseibium sp. TaxID=1936171 RepID=UPI002618F52E|nr:serine protease [uncultured Roseibium sp.]
MLDELITKVTEAAEADDLNELNEACANLIAHLPSEAGAIEPEQARKVLKSLRSHRRFDQMRRVANACLVDGCVDVGVLHFLAQGMIELGEVFPAIHLLEKAVLEPNLDEGDRGELRGALGRAWKDLAIQSRGTRPDLAKNAVQEAFRHYREAWIADNETFTYQGINMVAVANWDRCDGRAFQALSDQQHDEADTAAKDIVEILTSRPCYAQENWDYATIGEALLGVGDQDEALNWYGAYAKREESAFALAGSARQLQQLWRADKEDWGKNILALIIGKLGLEPGAGFSVSPGTLQSLADIPKARHEAILGDIGAMTHRWLQKGLTAAKSVAIIFKDGQPHGTGFAVRGRDLDEAFGDEILLVTNSHVVSEPVYHNAATKAEATVEFELYSKGADDDIDFSVKEIVWQSSPKEHDVAVLRLSPSIPDDLEPRSLYEELPALTDEKKKRVYIIGHPSGREISFSFQDNELLDYELEAASAENSIAPCRIHYRTPTEPGSSGSPIFDQNWRIIGIHHAGGRIIQKLNGKDGVYAANEGLWIETMRRALREREQK